jgi:pepF/M3 family oligoendopeptidase
MTLTAPRWDLSNIYPGLESNEYQGAVNNLKAKIETQEAFFNQNEALMGVDAPLPKLAEAMGQLIEGFNAIYDLSATLRAYLNSFISTDSHNTTAMRLQSEFEQANVRLQKLGVRFSAWVGELAPHLPEMIQADRTVGAHAFMLKETAEQSKYLMSAAEEALSAELNLSGANAWSKLQGTVTSQLTVDFELDGKNQKLPMPALINLHSHPDAGVRKRAYDAEMNAWQTVREPLAACMNGVKGTVNTLNRLRGRIDALHGPLDQARIDRPTLEAMLGAMQNSFPVFRRYFQAKARRFGSEKLAWWDIFAPTGKTGRSYTFDEARDFICEHFREFSPEMAAFARHAIENNWIDAEQREGKRGGAFCMGVPLAKESRILSNFDGSLGQVSTLAHELGHGFHNSCIYQAGKTALQRNTPMTMAETASIMCETIVKHAALEQASDPQEQLAILEVSLIGHAQVVVDIYSRYLFEKEVFERRANAELSADDLCDIMERAQKATFGEGVDERYLHKYMWTWKPHYYYAGLSFYNFPYAFGLLFGTGLYAIYQQRGAEFVSDYKNLLASTGEGTAAELADSFGINIRTSEFWEDSLSVIAAEVERYVKL